MPPFVSASSPEHVDLWLRHFVRYLQEYVDQEILDKSEKALAGEGAGTPEEIRAAVYGGAEIEPGRRLTLLERLGNILNAQCHQNLVTAEMLAHLRRILEKGGLRPTW